VLPSALAKGVNFFLHDPKLLLRYIGAGGTAALLELALFTALYQRAAWPLLAANSTALAVALVLCFILQKHWTFRVQGESKRQMKFYLLMQAISAVLNNFIMLALVSGLGLYAPVAKVMQIGIIFVWNFSFCRLVVFRTQDRADIP
jgi:putative flippase GtrA